MTNTDTTGKIFEIRTYGFSELALLYFPNITPKSAAQNLRNCIKQSTSLYNELQVSGYTCGQRILLPIHVKIFLKFLGEP